MSTDEIVEVGSDGTGGLDDGPVGDDDDLEVTPQGVVEDPGPDDDEDEGDEGGEEDWLAELDDETRDALGDKYSSPAEVARALAESQRLIGTQGNDVGQLRDDLARMAGELESLRADRSGGTQDEPAIPSYGDVQEYAAGLMARVDSGDEEPGVAMAAALRAFAQVSEAREKALIESLGQEVAAKTAPIEQHTRMTDYAREIASVKRDYGEADYAAMKDDAAALIDGWGRQDPEFAKNPRSIRTAFNEVFARQETQRRRESEAGILERTSRGPAREVNAAKAIVDDIESFFGGRKNGGGGL